MQLPLANWNGELLPLSEVRVSVLDRSFLFGDAIYEVVRIYRGHFFQFAEHMARLRKNLAALHIPADADRIAVRAQQTLEASQVQEGALYIHITRGEAPRTHRFPDVPPVPNELLSVSQLNDPYHQVRQQGGQVILIDDLRWKRCDIKSVNLLANCLGAQQAHEANCFEAIFTLPDGTLVEGTHTSLFAVQNGAILTAPLKENILPGITRRLVLRMAEQAKVPVVQQALHRDMLSEIDELFLTGTTSEIVPIVRADEITIGTGEPGIVTRLLQAAYQQIIREECP